MNIISTTIVEIYVNWKKLYFSSKQKSPFFEMVQGGTVFGEFGCTPPIGVEIFVAPPPNGVENLVAQSIVVENWLHPLVLGWWIGLPLPILGCRILFPPPPEVIGLVYHGMYWGGEFSPPLYAMVTLLLSHLSFL